MENPRRISNYERRKIRQEMKEKYQSNLMPIIRLIEKNLMSGDSIQLALKKACGSHSNALAKHVKKNA